MSDPLINKIYPAMRQCCAGIVTRQVAPVWWRVKLRWFGDASVLRWYGDASSCAGMVTR